MPIEALSSLSIFFKIGSHGKVPPRACIELRSAIEQSIFLRLVIFSIEHGSPFAISPQCFGSVECQTPIKHVFVLYGCHHDGNLLQLHIDHRSRLFARLERHLARVSFHETFPVDRCNEIAVINKLAVGLDVSRQGFAHRGDHLLEFDLAKQLDIGVTIHAERLHFDKLEEHIILLTSHELGCPIVVSAGDVETAQHQAGGKGTPRHCGSIFESNVNAADFEMNVDQNIVDKRIAKIEPGRVRRRVIRRLIGQVFVQCSPSRLQRVQLRHFEFLLRSILFFLIVLKIETIRN